MRSYWLVVGLTSLRKITWQSMLMCSIVCNKTIFKTTDLRNQISFPQVKVASYKWPRIRVALEHTRKLLPRGGGKGIIRTARMLENVLQMCNLWKMFLWANTGQNFQWSINVVFKSGLTFYDDSMHNNIMINSTLQQLIWLHWS